MCSQHVTLIGGEQAKNAKGGGGNRYKAYSRGDHRDPAVIFAGLADRR